MKNIQLFIKFLLDVFPNEILKVSFINEELVVHVKSEALLVLSNFLRKNTICQFSQLVDICAVDYPALMNRFELNYGLLSIRYNFRLRLKLFCNEACPVNSLFNVYASSNWLEREVWDLFGVYFVDHFDLRRILTDYGFEGFPLRKDFPLTGYVELRYDEEKKQIVYEPVELSQEFRFFDFSSPWDQTKSL